VRAYAGARLIEIAPICDAGADGQGAPKERAEPIAQGASIGKKSNRETRHVNFEEVKRELESGSKITKSEKKVKT